MTFLISGQYQNNRIAYRVVTDDFNTFELINVQVSYLYEVFPPKLRLEKNRPSFRNADKYLMQLIDEWSKRR
jgi:hypothetical protein